MVPELSDVDGATIGRVGVVLAPPEPQREGVIPSLVGGVKLVGSRSRSRSSRSAMSSARRGSAGSSGCCSPTRRAPTTDSASVIGIGQQVGATGAAGDWGTVLYFLAFVTVFIGLLNLIPLPPFDGGHLAVLGDREDPGQGRSTCAG